MAKRNPYSIIKNRHITEKTVMLENLKHADSNKSLARCEKPKYVFIVDPRANKREIAGAVEAIYKEQGVKVTAVNTIKVKAKPTRRTRAGRAKKASCKKAIVTLEPQDEIDNV